MRGFGAGGRGRRDPPEIKHVVVAVLAVFAPVAALLWLVETYAPWLPAAADAAVTAASPWLSVVVLGVLLWAIVTMLQLYGGAST